MTRLQFRQALAPIAAKAIKDQDILVTFHGPRADGLYYVDQHACSKADAVVLVQHLIEVFGIKFAEPEPEPAELVLERQGAAAPAALTQNSDSATTR